ncbi:MAG: DUF1343 domain-containing protein [Clostridia bacterium]|nr:DUF1343 domain-containing protein [Clostridia bacterium]
MPKAHVLSGIDRIDLAADKLTGKRVGLMTNPTGVDHNLRSTIDIIAEKFNLTALYAVEHGIRGDVQAGGRVDTCVDEATGVTVFSAYGKDAHFTEEMLDTFDVLVFDIQDVGARFYTYMYSMAYAMEACDRAGKSMVVLDRINPVGGVKMCGTVIRPELASFVGGYQLPTRYALTIGEFALYARDYMGLKLDLTVVPLEGWRRSMYLDDTDLPWVAPSPNCATLDAALVYLGTCIFEGTNVSEGRGTTQPFQLIGAPFLDSAELEKRMAAHKLPGLHFRRASFCPTFSKHPGVLCHGVQMHIIDREACDVFEGGLILMDEIRAIAGDKFEFLRYNYLNKDHYPLDKLLGTDEYRKGEKTSAQLVEEHRAGIAAFAEKAIKYRLYD